MASPGAAQRFNVLGVGVSAIDLDLAVNSVLAWVRASERRYVCVTSVHGIVVGHGDAAFRGILNRAGLVTPDGIPLVWWARRAGYQQVGRVYGPDLMLAVCAATVGTEVSHYLYGGAPGTVERLAHRLAERCPGIRIAGSESPPFRAIDEAEDAAEVERINAAAPSIVWVGLGTPKQERWMAAHRDLLKAPVLLGVGAAFDFIAGTKAQAPRWMQRSGLEWLFRLASEPSRLGPRYLVNNPKFLALAALQWSGLRRFPMD